MDNEYTYELIKYSVCYKDEVYIPRWLQNWMPIIKNSDGLFKVIYLPKTILKR